MIDLIDLKNYKTNNNGFCWILKTIDVHSKFAKAFLLKFESAIEVTDALQNLFLTFGPLCILQNDNRKEFTTVRCIILRHPYFSKKLACLIV
jgi:hypothetical protein